MARPRLTRSLAILSLLVIFGTRPVYPFWGDFWDVFFNLKQVAMDYIGQNFAVYSSTHNLGQHVDPETYLYWIKTIDDDVDTEVVDNPDEERSARLGLGPDEANRDMSNTTNWWAVFGVLLLLAAVGGAVAWLLAKHSRRRRGKVSTVTKISTKTKKKGYSKDYNV